MSLEDRLRALGRNDAAGGCPDPAALASFVAGRRRPEILEHLSRCASCREDAIAARARPPRKAVWIGAAAAALFALLLGVALFLKPEPEPEIARPPKPVVPKPAPRPEKPPAPKVEVPPPPVPKPPEPVPAPKVEPPPKPAPAPEPPPPPPSSVIVKPAPEPPKPAPAPTTVAKLRGSLLAFSGATSVQAEGEGAWQPVKLGQPREFSGSVKLRTDSAGTKARLGNATYYVRGGTELTIALEEGGTVVRLSKGEAFFDVVPGKETFVVEGAAGKVTVKGTRFLVAGGEVVVQRGRVEIAAGERTAAVAAGERSVGGQAAEKTDVARRLSWVKALDETITIEAESMVLQGGMALFPDAAASAGRAIGLKGTVAPGAEPAAEIKVKRKQPAPYTVWVRVLWSHGVPPGFRVQVHEAPAWSGKDVAGKPAWQWVRVGAYDLPDEAFRVRIVDPQGGARFDELLLTSDADLVPAAEK